MIPASEMTHFQRILIIENDPSSKDEIVSILEKRKFTPIIANSIQTASTIIKNDKGSIELIILNLDMPKSNEFISYMVKNSGKIIPIIVTTMYENSSDILTSLKTGAYDHVKKPINEEELAIRMNRALNEAKLEKEVGTLKKIHTDKIIDIPLIIGISSKITNIVNMIEKIARSDAKTVLIEGESGTGKELIAKSIHRYSSRADRPFIAINCAAIPETLLETELMGYDKGAYTDAKKDKKGLFELADGGTLFLDEIGDMGIGIQAKLLRILEEKTFRRVGGTEDIHVDVRIVAATNAKLKQRIQEGRFRDDLYYRLLVVPIYLPPLRDRKEDILILAEHFINKYNREFNKSVKGISEDAKKILKNYNWPGNIRELNNVIERALILENKDYILPEHLPYELILEINGSEKTGNKELMIDIKFKLPPEGIQWEDIEKSLVKQALEMKKGKQKDAATLLGMTRDSFRRRMKKYGIIE